MIKGCEAVSINFQLCHWEQSKRKQPQRKRFKLRWQRLALILQSWSTCLHNLFTNLSKQHLIRKPLCVCGGGIALNKLSFRQEITYSMQLYEQSVPRGLKTCGSVQVSYSTSWLKPVLGKSLQFTWIFKGKILDFFGVLLVLMDHAECLVPYVIL